MPHRFRYPWGVYQIGEDQARSWIVRGMSGGSFPSMDRAAQFQGQTDGRQPVSPLPLIPDLNGNISSVLLRRVTRASVGGQDQGVG